MKIPDSFLVVIASVLSVGGLVKAEIFADGGGGDRIAPCTNPWKYKDGPGEAQFDLDGCITFDQFQPWPFARGDNSFAVFPPTDNRTDLTRWCSTTDTPNSVYNPEPNVQSNRLAWGYCLDTNPATENPVASPPVGGSEPTISPTDEAEPTSTPAPNPEPTTSAPTLSRLQADGGFVTSGTLIPCLANWSYKAGPGAPLIEVNGCVGFDQFLPWPFATNEDSSSVIDPSNPHTDTNRWCSTRDVYNPEPDRSPENRLEWGFCLDLATTPVPTTVPPTGVPTAESTLAPTDAGTTNAPTVASTNAPTAGDSIATDAPSIPDGRVGNERSNSNDDTNVAAAVSIPIVLVALLGAAAILLVYRRRKSNDRLPETSQSGPSGGNSDNMTFAQRVSRGFNNGKERLMGKLRGDKTTAPVHDESKSSAQTERVNPGSGNAASDVEKGSSTKADNGSKQEETRGPSGTSATN